MDQRGVRGVSLVTTDHNLPKVAEAVGVPVPGLNDLAAAFRLPVGIGDEIERIGSGTPVVVRNVIKTATGRMVFANLR
jgi:uncharacterized protein YacL